MKIVVVFVFALLVSVLYAAPRASSHKMKRFLPELELGYKDLFLHDKKLTPEELARVMHLAGIKEDDIPALIDTIFSQNDWNQDNAIDEVELYGK